MLWRCPSAQDYFKFFRTFLPSLQLLHWNLVFWFAIKSNSYRSRFSAIYFILQELRPLNLEKLRIVAFSERFIEIFAAAGLKLGWLFMSND
jgi:hypothetical protein